MSKIKMLIVVVAIALLMPQVVLAGSSDLQTAQDESISISSKVPFKFYGFIAAETMWGDSGVASFGNTNAAYNRNITGVTRVIDESAGNSNDAFLDFTVQNTRFGFSLDKYDFDGENFNVDARIEMDFFATGNVGIHTASPRIRRAYAGIGQNSWRFLAGQEWDLFSPLNTPTLDVGSNMWFQGNMGFRRPQVRFTYNYDVNEETGLEFAGSLNLSGNSMSQLDQGVDTVYPMGQGRIGFWHNLPAGKMKAYLSGLYGRTNHATIADRAVHNWGLAASLDVPIHKYLKPAGEFQYGYSLGSLLSVTNATTREQTMAGWLAIKSCWLDWFETNIGYGLEKAKSTHIAAGSVKTNQKGFVNLKFMPVKSLVLGLEYNYLTTNYQGNGSSKANTVLFNTIFFF